jgi:hypothetical protein
VAHPRFAGDLNRAYGQGGEEAAQLIKEHDVVTGVELLQEKFFQFEIAGIIHGRLQIPIMGKAMRLGQDGSSRLVSKNLTI